MNTIQPGLQQIDDEVYHQLAYCSKHALDVIAEFSPLHLQYRRDHPAEPTDAMRLGRAFHTALLEPGELGRRHPLMTCCGATKKSGERCTNPGKLLFNDEWFCGTHANDAALEVPDALNAAQAERVRRMAEATRSNATAAKLLDAAGGNELAAVWDREVRYVDGGTHNVRCKLKADGIRPSYGLCFDVKTCESAAPVAFRRAIEQRGYHRQAAWYLDGLAAVGVDLDTFALIAVEKDEPHCVAVYELQPDAIEAGRLENELLLRRYAECDARGEWPGYPADVQLISVSDFKLRAAFAAA